MFEKISKFFDKIFSNKVVIIIENLQIHLPQILDFIKSNCTNSAINKSFDPNDPKIVGTFFVYKRNTLVVKNHKFVHNMNNQTYINLIDNEFPLKNKTAEFLRLFYL